jgi:hypothetical protein
MSEYLDLQRLLNGDGVTDPEPNMTPVGGNPSGPTAMSVDPNDPSGSKAWIGKMTAHPPGQQIGGCYPLDLFSAESAPFIIFVAMDPTQKSVIWDWCTLYFPKQLQVQYGFNVGEINDIVQGVNNFRQSDLNELTPWHWGGAAVGAAGGLIGGMMANASKFGSIAASAVGGIGGAMSSTFGAIAQQSSLQTKKFLNPHLAAVFQGANFRRHEFAFDLMARNEKESDEINKIIYFFKYWAHPESANDNDQGTWMKWPCTWTVGLYSPARKYLYNISTSLCTNIAVDYLAAGSRAFFSGTGAPVALRLGLSFVETELMTRHRMEQGY